MIPFALVFAAGVVTGGIIAVVLFWRSVEDGLSEVEAMSRMEEQYADLVEENALLMKQVRQSMRGDA